MIAAIALQPLLFTAGSVRRPVSICREERSDPSSPAASFRRLRFVGEAVTVAQAPGRREAFERLDELRRLEEGWDGYGAVPVGPGCLRHAETIMRVLPRHVPSPDITPTAGGTVSLDWEKGHQVLSVELGEQRYSAFWERPGLPPETEEGRIDEKCMPKLVARALATMYPATPAQTLSGQGVPLDAWR